MDKPVVPEKSVKRDVKFDGLRVIGLLAIILAHVNPPTLLFQLRNFDVPLMVLVSGAVYGLSSGAKKKYLSYIWGRILRLLLPTWVFLCVFFLVQAVFGIFYSPPTILSSLFLLNDNGIGYVWIIRIFILVAVISPFFVYLSQKIRQKGLYLVALLLLYALYTVLNHIYLGYPGVHAFAFGDFFVQNILFYLMPFGVIAGLGLYLLSASKRAIFFLFLLSGGVFSLFAAKQFLFVHHFVQTQVYKYPPGIYYLSFALAVSLLLYLVSYTGLFQKLFKTSLLQFIASSTLWIYLWQIFFLYQWNWAQGYFPIFLRNFVGEYLLVLCSSVLLTFLQKYIFGKIVGQMQRNWLRQVLTVLFLK